MISWDETSASSDPLAASLLAAGQHFLTRGCAPKSSLYHFTLITPHYAIIWPFAVVLHLALSPVISPQVVDSPSGLREQTPGRSAEAGQKQSVAGRKQTVSERPAAPSNEPDRGRQNLASQHLLVDRGPGNGLRNPGHA
jgi:hypothetical protein